MDQVIVLNWEQLLRVARLWVLISKLSDSVLSEFFKGEDKLEQLKDAEFRLATNSSELVITWEEMNNIRTFLIECSTPGKSPDAASVLIRQLTKTPGTDRDGAVMALAFHLMSVIVQ